MRASTSTSLLRVASSPRPGPALMEPRSPTTAPSPPTNTPAKAAESQTSTQLSTNYKEAHGHFPRDLPLLRPQLGGPPYLYSPSRISMRNNNIGSQLAASQSMPVLLSNSTPETRNGALIDQQGLQPHTPQTPALIASTPQTPGIAPPPPPTPASVPTGASPSYHVLQSMPAGWSTVDETGAAGADVHGSLEDSGPSTPNLYVGRPMPRNASSRRPRTALEDVPETKFAFSKRHVKHDVKKGGNKQQSPRLAQA